MPRHKKHTDNPGDSSSSGSIMDDTDREVSCLTDRAFRSLCLAEEEALTELQQKRSPGKSLQSTISNQVSLNRTTGKSNFLNRLSIRANEHTKWTTTFQQAPKPINEERKGANKTSTKPSIVEFTVPDLRKHSQRSKVSSLIKTFDNIENEYPVVLTPGTPRSSLKNSQKGKGQPACDQEHSAVLNNHKEMSDFSDSCHENYWLNEKYDAQKRKISKNRGQPSHDGFSAAELSASQPLRSATHSSLKNNLKHQKDIGKEPANKSSFLHSEHSAFKSWSDHHKKHFEPMNCMEWLAEQVLIHGCDVLHPLQSTHTSICDELHTKSTTDPSHPALKEGELISHAPSTDRPRAMVKLEEKEVRIEVISPSSSSSSSLISSSNAMVKKQVKKLPIELPSVTSSYKTIAKNPQEDPLVESPMPPTSSRFKPPVRIQGKEKLVPSPSALPSSTTTSNREMIDSQKKELLINSSADRRTTADVQDKEVVVNPLPLVPPVRKNKVNRVEATGEASAFLPVPSNISPMLVASSQEKGSHFGPVSPSKLLLTNNIASQKPKFQTEVVPVPHNKKDMVRHPGKDSVSSSSAFSANIGATTVKSQETECASSLQFMAPIRHCPLGADQEKEVLVTAPSSRSPQTRPALIPKPGSDLLAGADALPSTMQTNKSTMTHQLVDQEMGAPMDVSMPSIAENKLVGRVNPKDVPKEESSLLLSSHNSKTVGKNQALHDSQKVASTLPLPLESNKANNDAPLLDLALPTFRNKLDNQDHSIIADPSSLSCAPQVATCTVNSPASDQKHDIGTASTPWRRGKVKQRIQQENSKDNTKTPENVYLPHRPTSAAAHFAETKQECPTSNTSSSFNITRLLTPIIQRKNITEALEDDVELRTPPPGDISIVRDHEPRTVGEGISRETYRSKASGLLFNIKDVRKRVKSTYSTSPLHKQSDEQIRDHGRVERERVENVKLDKVKVEKRKKEIENVSKMRAKETLEKEVMLKERRARETSEREIMEREKLEREKLDREKLETEKLEREKLEKEKLEREKLEKEKLEREILMKEKLERELRENQEQEKMMKLEREILERENIEKHEREKMERLEREKIEREKWEKLERERIEKKKKEKQEREKIIRETFERENMEKQEREKIMREKIRMEKIEMEREEKENTEREKIEREKNEKEKNEKEKNEREKNEREMIEREKNEREKNEREKNEREKNEREKNERESTEREKIEGEKLEREHLEEKEKMAKLEQEKLEREKNEREKNEREKNEREKIEREKIEREKNERVKNERVKNEKETKEREKLEREHLEKKKMAKLEQEKLERDKVEREKLEREDLEKKKMAMLEQEKIEREKIEEAEWKKIERESIEKDRIQKEKLEKDKNEKLEREYLENLQMEKAKKEKAEMEKVQENERKKHVKELFEREKLEREKGERLERERLEMEKIEKEQIEREKIEKDKTARETIQKERIEREKIKSNTIEREKEMKNIETEETVNDYDEKSKIDREMIEKSNDEKAILERRQLENKMENNEREQREEENIEQEKMERNKEEKIEMNKIENNKMEQEKTAKAEGERIDKQEKENFLKQEIERNEVKRVKESTDEQKHVFKNEKHGKQNSEEEHIQKKKTEKEWKKERMMENEEIENEGGEAKMENTKLAIKKTENTNCNILDIDLQEEQKKVCSRKENPSQLLPVPNWRTFQMGNKAEVNGHMADNYLSLSSPQTIQDNVMLQSDEQSNSECTSTAKEPAKARMMHDEQTTQADHQGGRNVLSKVDHQQESVDPFSNNKENACTLREDQAKNSKLRDQDYEISMDKPAPPIFKHRPISTLPAKAEFISTDEQIPLMHSRESVDSGRARTSKSLYLSVDEQVHEEQMAMSKEKENESKKNLEVMPERPLSAKDVSKEELQYYSLSTSSPESEESNCEPQGERRWAWKSRKMKQHEDDKVFRGLSPERQGINGKNPGETKRCSSALFKPSLFAIKDNRFRSSLVTRAVKLPLPRSLSEDCLLSCQWDGGFQSGDTIGKERLGFRDLRDVHKAEEKALDLNTKQKASKTANTKGNGHGFLSGFRRIMKQFSQPDVGPSSPLKMSDRCYSLPKLQDNDSDIGNLFRKTGKSKELESRPKLMDTTAFIHARSISFESCTSPEDGMFYSVPSSESEYRMETSTDDSPLNRRGGSALSNAINDEIMTSPVVSSYFEDCLNSPASAVSEELSHFVDSAEYLEDMAFSNTTSPMHESIVCSLVASPTSENTTSSGFAMAMSTSEGLPSPTGTEVPLNHLTESVVAREPVGHIVQNVKKIDISETNKEGKDKLYPLEITGKMAAKPPTVPPKTEKALRRAKRLASKRRTNEVQQQKKTYVDGTEPILTVPSPMTASPSPLALTSSLPSLVPHKLDFKPVDPAVLRHTGNASLTPVSQTPLTQRKLLQDPDSGQYFVVDVPVQVQLKTFYEPDTGKYIQVSVPSSNASLMQSSSMEGLNSPYMVYPDYLPLSVTALPPTRSSSQLSAPATLMHDHLKTEKRDAWNRDLANRDFAERHPYIEPVCDSYSSSPYSMDTDSYDSRRHDIISIGDLDDFAVEGIS